MSQFAAFTACQMPFRLGLPSGMRAALEPEVWPAGRVWPETVTIVSATAAETAAAIAAPIMPMKRCRIDAGLLPSFGGGGFPGFPLLDPRAGEDAGQRVVPLVAGILQELVV